MIKKILGYGATLAVAAAAGRIIWVEYRHYTHDPWTRGGQVGSTVREEIHKEHLKHRQASSNGASSRVSNGTIIELDGQTPDDQPTQCKPNRRNKHPLAPVILPPPVFGGGLGYWVYLIRLESTVDEQE